MNPIVATEKFFLRVEGREYGPVDFATLQEWQKEGRLIPQNELRREDTSDWMAASTLPELFGGLTSDQPAPPVATEPVRRRSLPEIFTETFRIYFRGLGAFLGLSFLVALPALIFKISFAYVHLPGEGETLSLNEKIAAGIAVSAFAIALVLWPIFLGGLQFICGEIMQGRKARLREILRRAVNFWPRIARLCLFVYGSFFFWTALPFMVMLSLATAPSLLTFFAALLLAVWMVFMTGRLFINFLFWQQASTLGGLETAEALRESRELARSRVGAPLLQRPLYRGALIASLWVIVILAVSVSVEVPFMMVRLQGVTNFDDAFALVKTLSEARAPDAMNIASTVLGTLFNAVLRPLLGIAFVVLYYDAKSTR